MINVLIVEDDPMLAELNKRFVETVEGFKVVQTIRNGEEALECLESRNDIDLAIIDVYIPKMDGMQVFKSIRTQNKIVDFIIVTAAKDKEKIEEALVLGAFDYLVKPFEFERLKKSLLKYKERRELLTKQPCIGQSEIDKLFIGESDVQENDGSLKKGLHKLTLNRVNKYLRENNEDYLSSENISYDLGMSKVTIRRYLDYLESLGKVNKKIEYGLRGRPSYKYKYME